MLSHSPMWGLCRRQPICTESPARSMTIFFRSPFSAENGSARLPILDQQQSQTQHLAKRGRAFAPAGFRSNLLRKPQVRHKKNSCSAMQISLYNLGSLLGIDMHTKRDDPNFARLGTRPHLSNACLATVRPCHSTRALLSLDQTHRCLVPGCMEMTSYTCLLHLGSTMLQLWYRPNLMLPVQWAPVRQGPCRDRGQRNSKQH